MSRMDPETGAVFISVRGEAGFYRVSLTAYGCLPYGSIQCMVLSGNGKLGVSLATFA
jgi:hypothetical protein